MLRRLFLVALLTAMVAVPASANLVVNGGFEDPNVGSLGFYDTAGQIIGANGWVLGGSDWDNGQPDVTIYNNVAAVWGDLNPAEGNQFLMMADGNHNVPDLTQIIATVVGTDYTLRIAAKQDPAWNPWLSSVLHVTFGGLDEFISLPQDALYNGPWNYYERTITATSTSTTVFLGKYGQGGLWLDDISVEAVAAVPEPGSILALSCGLVGLIGLKRRLK